MSSKTERKDLSPRKKLIEVSIPLRAISEESSRRKRKAPSGYPTTFHKWWAQRPLAACRAVLFSSLVDDPDSDPRYQDLGDTGKCLAAEKRARLHRLVEDLILWENSGDELVINAARAEIARCIASRKIETGEFAADATVPPEPVEPVGPVDNLPRFEGDPPQSYTFDQVERMTCMPSQVNHFLATQAPPVLDPFCGGGSIPLEAQRLGLRAVGSDLNPVAVLITKALIEIPPKFAGQPPVHPGQSKKLLNREWKGAEGLAEDVRYYGKWMRDEAEKRIGHLYPKVTITDEMAADRPDLEKYVGRELTVIAWLWARTVASPNPAARGAHVPLARSFWLGKKKNKQAWAEPVVDRAAGTYRFTVRTGAATAEEKKAADAGTVNRRGGRCLLTGDAMPFKHIRSEGQLGSMKARLMSVVLEGDRERVYLSPIANHENLALSVMPVWRPTIEMPPNPRDFKTPNYGMRSFGDIFSARQTNALLTFSDLAGEAVLLAQRDLAGRTWGDDIALEQCGFGSTAYAHAIGVGLAFAVDRSSDFWSSLCTWANQPKNELVAHVFGRQALPMVWDYAEANPFSNSGGNFEQNMSFVLKCISSSPMNVVIGRATQKNAMDGPPIPGLVTVSTDPPYYDNIAYADLSDFFYVWMRRSLLNFLPDLMRGRQTPKKDELVALPYRHDNDKAAADKFFEEGLEKTFSSLRPSMSLNYPMGVFYAFKQTEGETAKGTAGNVKVSTGWDTMLTGVVDAGFEINGTWPVRSERPSGMKSSMNALASSIVLVCRPRPADAPTATRREFKRLLDAELPDALAHLRAGGIAPVDLAQAAIGPGMAVFTRHSKVLESDGSAMTVRTALGLINEVLDETLAQAEGDFDADTRWAVTWFEQHGPAEGPFGDAETLATSRNTSVDGLKRAGVITSRAGKVRLVPRDELPADWSPATDDRFTVWEAVQHLIRRQSGDGGERAAAALLAELGAHADAARDLAYRLYNICERNKLAAEGRAYNGLITAWPELTRLSRDVRATETQGSLLP